MALEFELPDTGEGVHEGKFLEWLVDEGEEVEEDQSIAEVETDKAVVDVPAPSDGTIKELKAEPGDTVDVGEVIMTMETGSGSTGESEEEDSGKESEDEAEQTEEEENDTEEEENQTEETGRDASGESGTESSEDNGPDTGSETLESSADVLALPKVRKLAEEKGVDLSKVDGSGPDGRITEEDVKSVSGDKTSSRETEETEEVEKAEENTETDAGTREGSAPANIDVKATPAVRQLAREKGVDLTDVVDGSGRGGKITREDVLEADGEVQESGETGAEVTSTEEGSIERVEMSPSNQVVADKMKESKFTAPHVTHVEKADVTELVELREEKKDEVDAHLTYLPFIMKAVLVGLKEYPDMNAELDDENGEIVRKKFYDLNIAVDTDRGLRTPVIENIDDRTIVELARDIGDKVEKTRKGEISKEEMSGGTFSITNIGVIGGDAFTPIINPPQVAILGIGRIDETAEVVDGEVKPRWTVQLSLSYDHRVIDGATAARFMNTVVENLEDPGELLMEI